MVLKLQFFISEEAAYCYCAIIWATAYIFTVCIKTDVIDSCRVGSNFLHLKNILNRKMRIDELISTRIYYSISKDGICVGWLKALEHTLYFCISCTFFLAPSVPQNYSCVIIIAKIICIVTWFQAVTKENSSNPNFMSPVTVQSLCSQLRQFSVRVQQLC